MGLDGLLRRCVGRRPDVLEQTQPADARRSLGACGAFRAGRALRADAPMANAALANTATVASPATDAVTEARRRPDGRRPILVLMLLPPFVADVL
jgi:hypothetical protein